MLGRPALNHDCGDMTGVDGSWLGDQMTPGSRFRLKQDRALERQEGTAMKDPVLFSTAFCLWLRVGGPLL